jgi:hypothetical protein
LTEAKSECLADSAESSSGRLRNRLSGSAAEGQVSGKSWLTRQVRNRHRGHVARQDSAEISSEGARNVFSAIIDGYQANSETKETA